jgi:transcriptional regulator with XRE-family HTH domain
MSSQSKQIAMAPDQKADYGFARVRDAAYDAVMELWRRRKAEGMTQAELAHAIGGDAGWLSRNLRGPGNWTLRTVGRLAEALNGEVEVKVHGLEDPLPVPPNYHAYVGYEPEITVTSSKVTIPQVGAAFSAPSFGKSPIVNTSVLIP